MSAAGLGAEGVVPATQSAPGGGGPGAVAIAAIAVAAFLMGLAGALWIVSGEAVFNAMAIAGAQMLCF